MTNHRPGDQEIASFKRKINNQLEPVKVMLVHLKDSMSKENWVKFVYTTRKSIVDHPDQYLNEGFPEKSIVDALVNQLFEEFLNRELDAWAR